jgi:hypothetical protein
VKRHSALAAAIAIMLSLAPQAARAEGGWQMPNLNPFKKSGPPTSSRVSDSATSGWKFPKLWPSGTTSRTTRKPAGPSTWQKMTTSTKSFFSKTADVLNPFDDADDNQSAAPPITGSNAYFAQAGRQKKKEEKSSTFLPSWWTSEEEKPQKAETVQDFLARPRPGF